MSLIAFKHFTNAYKGFSTAYKMFKCYLGFVHTSVHACIFMFKHIFLQQIYQVITLFILGNAFMGN